MNIQFRYRQGQKYPWSWYYSPQGSEFGEVINWMYTTFGQPGERWGGHGGWIMFKEEADASLFTLRWA